MVVRCCLEEVEAVFLWSTKAFVHQQENGGYKMASHMNPLNVGDDPTEWTDEEIHKFLKDRNISIPLTSSTKPQAIRKIQSLLKGVAVGGLIKGNGPNIAEESPIAQHSTSQSEAEPTCYYGVAVGERTDSKEPTSPYYTSRKDVLALSARSKGLRFKKFPTKEEAAQFSQTDVSVPLHSSCSPRPVAEEKANNFSEPKQPQLNRFKAVIERGDVEKFAECVWENPRFVLCYVISATSL